jgi:hypothetical protein
VTSRDRWTVCWFAVVVSAGAQQARAQATSAPAPPARPEELRQLVASIALYPDALVAQILAAATYPVQVVEAARWLRNYQDGIADQVAAAADSQSWDPSIKALTQFPSVLAMLSNNLSWTSALGDAYASEPQDILEAIQTLRARARDAGTLSSTPQQTVATEGQNISIAPASPDTVYVPTYDPCTIYGSPIVVYDDWDCSAEPFGLAFGPGVPIGWWPSEWGWGWHAWGFDWRRHALLYHRGAYISNTNTFLVRRRGYGAGLGQYARGANRFEGFARGGNTFINRVRGQAAASPRPVPAQGFWGARAFGATPSIRRNNPMDRGFGEARLHLGTRSGALTGFGQGGSARVVRGGRR